MRVCDRCKSDSADNYFVTFSCVSPPPPGGEMACGKWDLCHECIVIVRRIIAVAIDKADECVKKGAKS